LSDGPDTLILVTDTNTTPVLTPGEKAAVDKMVASFNKIVACTDPVQQAAKLAEFRNILFAARTLVPKFNKALGTLRDFRGEDFAEGVEPIVLHANSAGKAGRPRLTEAEKLNKLFG
jgi:hypothetical protein